VHLVGFIITDRKRINLSNVKAQENKIIKKALDKKTWECILIDITVGMSLQRGISKN
jgi:hypothetical protein